MTPVSHDCLILLCTLAAVGALALGFICGELLRRFGRHAEKLAQRRADREEAKAEKRKARRIPLSEPSMN